MRMLNKQMTYTISLLHYDISITRKVLKQINLYHSPVKISGGQSIFYDQLYYISIKVFDFLKEKKNHVNLRKLKYITHLWKIKNQI